MNLISKEVNYSVERDLISTWKMSAPPPPPMFTCFCRTWYSKFIHNTVFKIIYKCIHIISLYFVMFITDLLLMLLEFFFFSFFFFFFYYLLIYGDEAELGEPTCRKINSVSGGTRNTFSGWVGQWRNWVFIWGGRAKGGGRLSSGGGGGQEDGIAMIYCAQSKVKWGSNSYASGVGVGVLYWKVGQVCYRLYLAKFKIPVQTVT